MKEEIAQRWIQALRSGEYKQGKSFLRLGEEYCCLGVLCSLAFEEDPSLGKWELVPDSSIHTASTTFDHTNIDLPVSVRRWAGLKERRGQFPKEEDPSLTARNDRGDTFEEIAQVIEENWSKL